ncbi:hypothetical protein EQH57_0865, partial [Dictyocoela roeselum]
MPRHRIWEEFRRLRGEAWNNMIEKTDAERNSKDFWTSIKRMIGQTSSKQMSYLKDSNNEEVHDDDKKEEIFRRYWREVFKISEEENRRYDRQTDEMVNSFLEENYNKVTSYEKTSQQRLTTETTPVTRLEIMHGISKFKQKSPGPDEITKKHLSNLPTNMIENYRQIVNASYSTGSFPQQWKVSTI